VVCTVHPFTHPRACPDLDFTRFIQEKQGKERAENGEKGSENEDGNGMDIAERILVSFASYDSLKRVRLDSEYERLFGADEIGIRARSYKQNIVHPHFLRFTH
jgi:hypothetical protein